MSIRIDDLTVTFKNGVTAVDHVDLEIPHGIFGLLGENGAGKTTLMRVLTTVLAPTSGKVLLDGTLYCEANYELVDFAEERTVLFSTHVVEDLMATCNQLAVMKKGRFLYTGTMRELLNKARGHVWECCTEDESLARELERKYHISSKQYTEEGIRLRLLGENMPSESGCIACDVTLEDAYIYVTNR